MHCNEVNQNKLTLYNLYQDWSKSSSNIVFCDGTNVSILSYSKFQIYVNDISSFLNSLSVSKSNVCCLIKPSLLLPAVILGILKTSSTFAFLDVYKPVESLISFQKYLQIRSLFVEKCYIETLLPSLCSCWKIIGEISLSNTFVILQSFDCEISTCPKLNYQGRNKAQSEIAYAIQTSGTTGEPKIVQVPHECIVPNVTDFCSRFKVTSDDILLQSTRITFDPSIIEIFLALSTGATLVMIADHIRSIPKLLADVITSNKITFFQATPSLVMNLGEHFLKNILLHDDSPLRILAFGGEVCPSMNKLQKWKGSRNRTEIYNLYGLTEVSCWASCFKMNFDKSEIASVIPIGKPLLNTKLEICNGEGRTANEGELFIGGKRFCIINNEQWPSSDNFMRPTGDLVYKTCDGFICFEGRSDSVIKYKGHKISLCLVNNFLDSISEVKNYYVHFNSVTATLYLFVVWPSIRSTYLEMESELVQNIRKSILNLPAVVVVSVNFMPLTKHGKCDAEKLTSFAKTKKLNVKNTDENHEEYFEEFISMLWKKYTNQNNILETDNFVLNGGDSISAVQFAADVEWNFQLSIPVLIEKILNETFSDVKNIIKFSLSEHQQLIPYHESNMNFVDALNLSDAKRRKYEHVKCIKAACKQGYFEKCFCGGSGKCNYLKSSSETKSHPKVLNLDLNLVFKWDLRKCIDATPCILYFPDSDQYFVFIGSHFGQFSCIDLNKQQEIWHVLVSDRIESSACISACGNYVVFGCYDHFLYCFNIENGNLHWKFETHAEVKSSPSVSSCNTVFVGSHDMHLYAVNVENGCLLWKKQIASGSIFSSPTVIEDIQAVCVATLDGVLALLKMESGDILWKYHSTKPLFSSPVAISNFIYIGSTNNSMLCFDFSGKLKFAYQTDGSVFSSTAYCKESECIVFGCHDNTVYCLSNNGALVWKSNCDATVYSTPFTFKWCNEIYIVSTSSKGSLYIIQVNNGRVVYSWKFPGGIFSSPVVLNDVLVVGCRDNNVYCFKLKNL